MNRVARYISLIVLATIVTLSAIGCSKNDAREFLGPKHWMYGVEKNIVQYRLNVTDPSNQAKSWQLDPTKCFYAEVEGSSVIRSTASLPDGTIYAVLEVRINQISGDARVNDSQVDWAWIIGGGFYASAKPLHEGDPAQIQVEITNFATAHPELVTRLTVVIITPFDMGRIKDAIELGRTNPTAGRTALESVTNDITGHYGVSISEAKLLPSTPKEN